MAESFERGALTEATYFILLSLYTPKHGYAVMQFITALTCGRVNLGAGTLYGALNTLLEKQWIVTLDGEKNSRKKEYKITTIGQQVVQNEIKRLEELLKTGREISCKEGEDDQKSL